MRTDREALEAVDKGAELVFVWGGDGMVQRCIDALAGTGTTIAILPWLVPLFATLPPALEDARAHQGWLWSYTANFYIAAKDSWALGYVSHFWSLAIRYRDDYAAADFAGKTAAYRDA